MKTKLRVLREGGRVTRFHQCPWNGDRQNNASHSWGVAVLLEYLWPNANRATLLLAALLHDVHEGVSGTCDVSSHVKWIMSPEWRAELDVRELAWEEDNYISEYTQVLNHNERVRLKLADMLELYTTAVEQRSQGNRFMDLVVHRIDDAVRARLLNLAQTPHIGVQRANQMVEQLRVDFLHVAGFEPEDYTE